MQFLLYTSNIEQKFVIYFQVVCFYSRILRPRFLSSCVETALNGDLRHSQMALGTVSKNWLKVSKSLYFAKGINAHFVIVTSHQVLSVIQYK
jgi:hypothetical protein